MTIARLVINGNDRVTVEVSLVKGFNQSFNHSSRPFRIERNLWRVLEPRFPLVTSPVDDDFDELSFVFRVVKFLLNPSMSLACRK